MVIVITKVVLVLNLVVAESLIVKGMTRRSSFTMVYNDLTLRKSWAGLNEVFW